MIQLSRRFAPFVFVLIVVLIVTGCGPTTTTPSANPTSIPPNTVSVTVTTSSSSGNPTQASSTTTSTSAVTPLQVGQGYGAEKGFWQVFFTAPTGSRDASTYVGGIDEVIASYIDGLQHTLDIAAYEFNSPALTAAVLRAKARGLVVRVVTDDHDGLGDSLTTLHQLEKANIPIVTDNRSALMHDKIMIMDSTWVVTGSWNYSVNDTYRNNNNALVITSQMAVQDYQAEFNEMFVDHKFGPSSPANTPHPEFTQDGDAIGIYFSPEDDVLTKINDTLKGAQHQIRFMTFSFTEDPIGQTLIARAGAGIDVEGIFEKTGSETKFSELTSTFCAGLQVRQDGNPFVLHHKVFIIDGTTVISGSFNVSNNATSANDENLIKITDPDLAAQYLAEFDRRWAEATVPTKLSCN